MNVRCTRLRWCANSVRQVGFWSRARWITRPVDSMSPGYRIYNCLKEIRGRVGLSARRMRRSVWPSVISLLLGIACHPFVGLRGGCVRLPFLRALSPARVLPASIGAKREKPDETCRFRRGRSRAGFGGRRRAGRERRARGRRRDDRLGPVHRPDVGGSRCRVRVPVGPARLLETARGEDPDRRGPRQAQGAGRAVPGRDADEPRRSRRFRAVAGDPWLACAEPCR